MPREVLLPNLPETRTIGLPIAWQVDSGYQIQEWRSGRRTIVGVQPVIGKTTIYTPATRIELPSEIAKLEREDREAVIRFAGAYGSLGYWHLLPTADRLQTPYGDPLGWIWLHAETLNLCLSFKEMLDQGATNGLERRLWDLTPRSWSRSNLPAPVVTFASQAAKQSTQFFATKSENRTIALRGVAATILETVVNNNIAGLHPMLAWDQQKQTFVHFFRITALIEVAYWHLANVLRGGLVKRCARPGCGGLFIQTDGRQQYCPTGTKQESRCAVLERVKRLRGKRAKGGPGHGKKKRKR
jgi:hypothetical protein